MDFQPEIIGPAIHARKLACRPGEPLLWAAFTRRHYFAVPGLSASGTPRESGLKRAALGAADFLTSYTPGVFDPGPDRPPPPDVVVLGPGPDCAAVALMSLFVREKLVPAEGVPRHLWALTPERLRLLGPAPASVSVESAESGSMLGKFGKGLMDAVSSGKKPAVAELDRLVPVFDIPRDQIGGFAVADLGVRLSLMDGSALDFVFGGMDREASERMLALTLGGA